VQTCHCRLCRTRPGTSERSPADPILDLDNSRGMARNERAVAKMPGSLATPKFRKKGWRVKDLATAKFVR
jgi:hypothetical protein